jgi:AhpD family alkylhydroperoxidase
MAIAVHSETKCRYCSLLHIELARLFGAGEEEIQEAVHFAKYTVGWSVYLNGIRYDFDQFETEVKKIIDFLKGPRPLDAR